ncbi:MAG TPA: hypothetical protein PKD30_02690 [Saprospiraceae bacterium]|nr:hypothetical protein [Saprospiraceae bacterium]HNA63487.1 hypothetical protein [Saprospiraceae bacterium]HNF10314.1 hypothetical protein [Saprospiraceae bacterium]
MNFRLLLIFILMLVFWSCHRRLGDLANDQKLRVLAIDKIIENQSLLRLDSSVYALKKTDTLTAYKDDHKQIIRFMRSLSSTASFQTINLYFEKGELVSSLHKEINQARIKNQTEITRKQYYFQNGSVIYAEMRSVHSARLSNEQLLHKLNLTKPRPFKHSPYIYRDEIIFFEKNKNNF